MDQGYRSPNSASVNDDSPVGNGHNGENYTDDVAQCAMSSRQRKRHLGVLPRISATGAKASAQVPADRQTRSRSLNLAQRNAPKVLQRWLIEKANDISPPAEAQQRDQLTDSKYLLEDG